MTTVWHHSLLILSFAERIFPMNEQRPNFYPLKLPTETYIALIDRMSALKIGKGPAIIDAINETLHNEGFLNDEDYEMMKQKYRRKLIDVVKEGRKRKPVQTKPHSEIVMEQKRFVMVLDQLETISEKSKQFHIKKAMELKDDIPEAKEFLRKLGILHE